MVTSLKPRSLNPIWPYPRYTGGPLVHDIDRTDLDETRRLLYMALLRPKTDRWYNLAGTLVNALAHHSRLATADEAIEHVSALCGDGDAEQAVAWVQNLIRRITEQLGD
jgi:hypothetical protein